VIGAAILLALAGACGNAVAAWLQQGAVREVTGGGELRLAGWARMVRAPRWISGFGLTAGSATLHAIALSIAPLVVVQPIGVLAIALTTLLAARSTGLRLTRATSAAVLASMLGIGLFVLLAARGPVASAAPDGVEVRAVLLVGFLIAVAAGIGAVAGGRVRCVGFAAAAGMAYGLVSVLVHASAVRVATGGFGDIHLDTLAAIAAALVTGGWFVQHAYAAGPPQVVVACQTVLDPMIAVGIAIGLLGEAGRFSSAAIVGLVAGSLLAVGGVIVLARRPSAPMIPEQKSTVDGPGLAIVVGADTFPPDINGASHFAERLARGLAGRGHEVHVLCPATAAGPAIRPEGGTLVHRVASRGIPFHPTFRICLPWRAFRAAHALLDEVRPDVVHTQAHFLIGRALVRAAARRGIPVVATNHFMPENLYGHGRIPAWLQSAAARLGWWDLRRVFGAAQAVTAPTPRAVELLRDNGLTGAVPVSCGIDLDHFGVAAPVRDDRRVLFVGRLDEEKRVDELLRAAALLDVGVDLVGDGSCRIAWQELAHELGIADRVTFHGFVDDTTLLARYAGCTVFCMPGVAELQSLATMEAMAAGAPVVAADAMALPHLVRPGRNGWLFPPGDVPALAARLAAILDDPAQAARMGRASREIIAEHSLAGTLTEFEALYVRVCGRVPVAPQPLTGARA
jgi:glycosyltransferase involved in cell wall biosynthesis